MTMTTVTRNNAIFVKPFTELLPPIGAEVRETYDHLFTYQDSEGGTYTDTERFSRELTVQEIEDLWGYFYSECDCVKPLHVEIVYPHCNLPAYELYENGVLEF